jgi:glycosyltransferase involved in cell wall biosynthesis
MVSKRSRQEHLLHSTCCASSSGNAKVTVVLLTYNHEKYIAQALESVLTQQTEFVYEVVVLDDCSTDRTRDVLYDFKNRYPDIVQLVLAERNQNDNRGWGREILDARSPYVALLDGDDYWTSPYKLQKQADFLDQHLELSMCFHGVTVFYEDRDKTPWISGSPKDTLTLADLIEGNFVQTCSIMLRGGLITSFPEWWYVGGIGDWELLLFFAQHGDVGYIDEVMGAYRKHVGGIYTASNDTDRIGRQIRMYENINRYFDFKHNTTIKNIMSELCHDLAIQFAERQDWSNAKTNFMNSVAFSPLNERLRLNYRVNLFIRLFAPAVYKLIRKLKPSAA